MPVSVAECLLEGARAQKLSAGDAFHCDGGALEQLIPAIVVDGLLRIYRRGADGRELTVRYAAEGDLLGIAGVLAGAVHGPGPAPALPRRAAQQRAEAVRTSTLLQLNVDGLRATLRSEPGLAIALCRCLYRETVEVEDMLVAGTLLPVRSRVACHLLNLAERRDRELVVQATAQHLAAAVGSVREVVNRVLSQLEAAGFVQRRPHQVVLLDAAALHRVWAGQSGL